MIPSVSGGAGGIGGDNSASGDVDGKFSFDNGGFNYKSSTSGSNTVLYIALAIGGLIALKKFKVF